MRFFEVKANRILQPRPISQPFENQSDKKILVDLAVPRNIAPHVQSKNVQLPNIDDLHQLLEERKAILAQKVLYAEGELFQAVKRQIALFRPRSIPLALAVSQ